MLAKVQKAGFDKAELILKTTDMTEMQVDAGDISLMRNTEDLKLGIRGIRGGRFATVNINQTDEESLQAGISNLNAAIDSAPIDPARAFAPKQAGAKVEVSGPKEPDLEKMYQRLSDFLTFTENKYPLLKLEMSTARFYRFHSLRVNSEGLELDESSGYYSMMAMFSSKMGKKTSSFNYSGTICKDLNRDFIEWGSTARLIESSVKEVNHEVFKGKFKGSVVLTPDCVYGLLGTWFAHLQDDRMIAKTSQLEDRMGQKVASSLLTVRVETHSSEFAVQEHSTGDGYLSQPSLILENGVLKSFMLSDYGARKTGHPRAQNSGALRLIDPGANSYEEIIASTKQGLLLGRFSGGSPSANGDFSGVAKNSFLIEEGIVTRPLSEIMISGNAFEVMHSISAISKERVNNGSTLTPWIKIEGLTVAGTY